MAHDTSHATRSMGITVYGIQGSGNIQALGASAGGSVGLALTFAMFDLDLPSSGTGPMATVTSFAETMAMSGLVALSVICLVVAFRLIAKTRQA